jgi:hypothetical protein
VDGVVVVVVESLLEGSIALGFISPDGGGVVVESLFELVKSLSNCIVFNAVVKMIDVLDKEGACCTAKTLKL